ncbi:organic radical activating enzyme [Arcicella aurantiaca]|uniref:7-carboxy-7-deazaguanine synthase n=1 Tax=Arcicella aurantiaca TaxID=591202 RepID=A0A316ED38_9BACT|nr:7-carboxy-7-deazaguanine synthase QueE [Arcicella aurantiaca]PWK28489.1 organic radical activating enzyme [Arcicella aurantiaca]
MVTENIQSTTQALPVMEAFYTLQGEGFHQGRAAYFIRLGGCDVGCHWCDVKESWDINAHPKLSLEQIVEEASQHQGRLAVVTGGEPLMHNLEELTTALHQAGFETNIETSGVCEQVTGDWDWICFSPKKFKKPNPEIYPRANELKVIIYNQSDFEWAESFADVISSNCMLYLQPEWSRMETMLPEIIEYIKNNPKWRISLQVHKFMDIP